MGKQWAQWEYHGQRDGSTTDKGMGVPRTKGREYHGQRDGGTMDKGMGVPRTKGRGVPQAKGWEYYGQRDGGTMGKGKGSTTDKGRVPIPGETEQAGVRFYYTAGGGGKFPLFALLVSDGADDQIYVRH